MKPTPDPDGWTSECPTQVGTYEYKTFFSENYGRLLEVGHLDGRGLQVSVPQFLGPNKEWHIETFCRHHPYSVWRPHKMDETKKSGPVTAESDEATDTPRTDALEETMCRTHLHEKWRTLSRALERESNIWQLRAKAAEKQVGEFEEREASCCPEDVGCDEHIRNLNLELAEAMLTLERMTNPQWRPHKLAGSETFNEDRAMEIINHVAEEFTDLGETSFATPQELCQTIQWLRDNTVDKSFDESMQEQHAATEKAIAQLDLVTKLAESETRLAAAERAQYQAEKAMIEIEAECMAWKALAGRLATAFDRPHVTDCLCARCANVRDALGELGRMREGKV